jgi:predicted metal-dependent HD superfamily phosphohydrolase
VPLESTALDPARWTELWSRLGARGNGHRVLQQLSAAYAEPARAYHTAAHIRDCLTQLDRSRELTARPDEVEAALWFHDAVYVPGAPDNEERSARMAQAAMVDGQVPQELAHRVAELVRATRHQMIPDAADARLVCDIDLSILGREPEIFDDFERKIRREFAWVPEPAYRSSRSEVLAGFLRRRFIYQTEYFRAWYEASARQNLKRILSELAS